MKTISPISIFLLGLLLVLGLSSCSHDHDPNIDNFGKAVGGFKVTTSEDLHNLINIEAEVLTFKNGIQKITIDENVVENKFETTVSEFPMKALLSITMTRKKDFVMEEDKTYDLSLDIETYSTVYDHKQKQVATSSKSFHIGSTQDSSEGINHWLKQTFSKPITSEIEINEINRAYEISIK